MNPAVSRVHILNGFTYRDVKRQFARLRLGATWRLCKTHASAYHRRKPHAHDARQPLPIGRRNPGAQ
jgi:hypothetical protein